MAVGGLRYQSTSSRAPRFMHALPFRSRFVLSYLISFRTYMSVNYLILLALLVNRLVGTKLPTPIKKYAVAA